MAKKGSKYSQKHTVETPVKQDNILDDADLAFLDVIYDDISFLDTFAKLNVDEQIKVYMTLKKISETSLKKPSKAERHMIHESAYKIDKINDWAGLKKEEMLRYPLSQDEHHIIRMDCYGTIDKRPAHQLSQIYKNLRHKKLDESLPPESYHLYSMQDAPAWQIFRQFENFRKIEPQLQKFLSDNKYNPQILKLMGTKDFSDLIFETFKKDDKQINVRFIKGDSVRNSFVKELSNRHGDKIETVLRKYRWDERCITSMLNAMKSWGTTDSQRITVTEINFNERILNNLNNAGIPVDGYQIGNKIPTQLIDMLSEQNKLGLIEALDDTGKPLKCPHSFEVHHKVAVSESGKLPCVASVNYCSNYVLVGTNMHQNVLHLFDKLVKSEGKEAYRCRIEFQNPDIAFMNGFSPTDCFAVNWENDLNLQKRAEEDRIHIISYNEVMEQLYQNRLEYKERSGRFDINRVVNAVMNNCLKARRQKGRN